MKRLAVAVAAVVVALALSPSAASAATISGKYRGKVTSGLLKGTWTINFMKKSSSKGTYKVTGPFGSLTGRLAFSGSTVTFSHESEGSMCPNNVGRYRFKITGKKLKLTKIRDSCGVRAIVHSPTYTRIG